MSNTGVKRWSAALAAAMLVILGTTTPAWSADDPSANAEPAKPAEKPAEAKPAPKPSSIGQVPSLEDFLQRAMPNHPDVAAARAKVELAEVELRQTQLRVANELTTLHTQWASEAESARLKEADFNRGELPAVFWVEVRGNLAAVEGKAKLLLSQKPLAKPAAEAEAAPPAQEPPAGPLVGKMRAELKKMTALEFHEYPLDGVLTYLSDLHLIKFMADTRALEENAIAPDIPVTLKLTNVPLGAGLQALEDVTGLRFVMRDYGFVVTTRNPGSLANRSLSAVQFWESSLDEESPAPDAQ